MKTPDKSMYELTDRDWNIVLAVRRLLWKVVHSPLANAKQVEIVAKTIQKFECLPNVGENLDITIDLTGPLRIYGEHEITHSWQIMIDEHDLEVSSGGRFYRKSTGSDSFTCMTWTAAPGYQAELSDFSAYHQIVDDAMPFEPEIAKMDLSESGYILKVSLKGEDLAEGSKLMGKYAFLPSCENSEQIIEERADFLKAQEVHHIVPDGPSECDFCGRSFANRKYWIDGRIKDDILWANMCSGCFLQRGEGLGWGQGQLFAKQNGGVWLLVAGFDPHLSNDNI